MALMFLYRNVGLLWEKQLSLAENRNMCSLVKNKKLAKFFKQGKVIYNITNRGKFDEIETKLNEFHYTDTKSSKVRSLMSHLRNSVMHGRYKVLNRNLTEIIIKFEDQHQGTTNMTGKMSFKKLQELIAIIESFNG